MSEPRYTATVSIQKSTPRTGTVGFTEAAREPVTEEVAQIKVSSTDLASLKGRVAEHLNLVQE